MRSASSPWRMRTSPRFTSRHSTSVRSAANCAESRSPSKSQITRASSVSLATGAMKSASPCMASGYFSHSPSKAVLPSRQSRLLLIARAVITCGPFAAKPISPTPSPGLSMRAGSSHPSGLWPPVSEMQPSRIRNAASRGSPQAKSVSPACRSMGSNPRSKSSRIKGGSASIAARAAGYAAGAASHSLMVHLSSASRSTTCSPAWRVR